MKAYLLCLPITLLIAGCRSIPDRSIQTVSQRIEAQSRHSLREIRSDRDLSKIDAQVESLLQTNLTLNTAIQIALLNNRQLHATFEDLGIAEADLIQAGLLQNIQLAGSWRFPDPSAPYNNIEYGASANILDWFMLPLRKKVAAKNLEAAELRVTGQVLRLMSDVRRAFLTLQARQQLLERLQVSAQLNESALELAKRQKEAGNITDLQFATHQAVYAQSRLELAQARSELRIYRERLNRLLGLWGPMTTWQVTDLLQPIPDQEPDLENLEARAITNRLDLAAARKAIENSAYSLRLRQKTRFLPASIHVGVSTEKEPDGQRITGPELEIELPLFDQGHGELARLSSQYRRAQRQFEALAVNIRSEVRELRDLIVASRDTAEYYKQVLLPQQRTVVQQTLLQYNAMQVGTYDLINAKAREVEMERRYIDAWRNYWIAHSELERALVTGGQSMDSESLSQAPQSFSQTSADTH
jgi:outer membrane protein, heavy metal efflux system